MQIAGWPLALFRVAFGLLYLDMALQKAPWINFGWLKGFIEKEIGHPAIPAVAAFFKSVVLPNCTFRIEVTSGGQYGLHIYASGYIYAPRRSRWRRARLSGSSSCSCPSPRAPIRP